MHALAMQTPFAHNHHAMPAGSPQYASLINRLALALFAAAGVSSAALQSNPGRLQPNEQLWSQLIDLDTGLVR